MKNGGTTLDTRVYVISLYIPIFSYYKNPFPRDKIYSQNNVLKEEASILNFSAGRYFIRQAWKIELDEYLIKYWRIIAYPDDKCLMRGAHRSTYYSLPAKLDRLVIHIFYILFVSQRKGSHFFVLIFFVRYMTKNCYIIRRILYFLLFVTIKAISLHKHAVYLKYFLWFKLDIIFTFDQSNLD